MRLAYYVQTSRGLGHLFRAHKILAHLSTRSPDWQIFALTDSEFMLSIAAGHEYRAILIPQPLHTSANQLSSAEFTQLLFRLLVQELNLDMFVASHWRCLANELRLLVPRLRKAGVKIVLALRDIIGQPAFEREISHAYGMPLQDILALHIDGIAVFGSEHLHSLTKESPAFACSERLSYCGFIPPLTDAPYIYSTDTIIQCVVGGGFASEEILEATMAAVHVVMRRHKVTQIRFVTGPYCHIDTVIKLHKVSSQYPGISVTSFNPSWYHDLPVNTIVICAGGYNTVTEVLHRGLRSICIPKSIPGIDAEQTMRTRSLTNVAQMVTVTEPLSSDEIINKLDLIWDLAPLPTPWELFDPGRRFQHFIENIRY